MISFFRRKRVIVSIKKIISCISTPSSCKWGRPTWKQEYIGYVYIKSPFQNMYCEISSDREHLRASLLKKAEELEKKLQVSARTNSSNRP